MQTITQEIDSLYTAPRDESTTIRAFNPVHYIPGERPGETFPLTMVVRDVLTHAGSMSTRSKSLTTVASEALLEVGRQDAERLGIADKGHVKVTSRRGTVYLKAAVTDAVPDGTVYVPAHFPHSGVNNLTCPSGNGEVPLDAVRIEAL